MSSNNMYRVGDFVFFEASATAPYQIRRIDELNKTPTGAVEAKVTCYYRRRDISSTLIQQAEKYYFQENDTDSPTSTDSNFHPEVNGNDTSNNNNKTCITDLERHQIKHRELFLSRQIECLPATHIRGKCSVTLYNDVEPITSYVLREDAFYYRLIYDPSTKRLQEDRGSMRIGSDYQSEIQPLLEENAIDTRLKQNLEELVWDPVVKPNTSETALFINLTKAVGLFARSCDVTNSQSLLLNAATAASRDVTLQFAHDILFKAGCDVKTAMSLLVPNGKPTLCRDELESWTASESALFEEALEKYSKFFPDILTDFLPWKTSKSIVELYYFWKTTDRYIKHRRNKLAAHEHKLKQVYIPNYSKPNSVVLYNRTDSNDHGCECCHAESSPQWYAWGPPTLMCRLCSGCWAYWKKYGGLKNPDKRDRLDSVRGATQQPLSKNMSVDAMSCNTNPVDNLVDHRSAPAHHQISDASLTSVIYRCSQPNCVKEFRCRDNLAIHLAQVHNVSVPPTTLVNSSNSNFNKVPFGISTNDAISAVGLVQRGISRTIAEKLLLPGSSIGGVFHSGTECLVTPSSLRIARTLFPRLLRPILLARRPTKLANLTAKRSDKSPPRSPLSTDDLLENLKSVVRLQELEDPASILTFKIAHCSLDEVINKLKKKKIVPLSDNVLNECTADVVILPKKRKISSIETNGVQSSKLIRTVNGKESIKIADKEEDSLSSLEKKRSVDLNYSNENDLSTTKSISPPHVTNGNHLVTTNATVNDYN